jgi:hypothetical protein
VTGFCVPQFTKIKRRRITCGTCVHELYVCGTLAHSVFTNE